MLRIKEILQEKGITGKEMAERLKITENAFSLIVNEKRQPRYELLLKIAQELDVDIRDLFKPTKQFTGQTIYIKKSSEYLPIGKLNIELNHK